MGNLKKAHYIIPIILLLLICATMQAQTLFNFKTKTNTNYWTVVNDVVMGGKSSANLNINREGNGVFTGHVSLENNGGFSSLRHRFNTVSTKLYSKIILKIKGDGKKYQFRIKSKSSHRYSYIHNFETSGEWQTIEILMHTMQPKFRGRKLNMPNYSNNTLEEIAFLIGNKKDEGFKLIIDEILLK